MALIPGTRLGLYEVSAKIGEGGLGEVYQARQQARPSKLLREAFRSDAERHSLIVRELFVSFLPLQP